MSDDVNTQMIIVTLVPNDRWTKKRCPNCHKPFQAGERVFESYDAGVALHVSCVVALALTASLDETAHAPA